MGGQATYNLDMTLTEPLGDGSGEPMAPLPTVSVGGSGAEIELGEAIGTGGHAVVYRAWQPHLERHVAVKTARESGQRGVEEALVQEARWAAQVGHPNVVPVHQVGRDPAGNVVIVMREIQGQSFLRVLQERPPADITDYRRYVGVLVGVCRALGAAHDHGVVHCDVKPHNVFLGRYGEVYLGDWGVARDLGRAIPLIRGTPGYLAPELARGEPAQRWTDVYLVGATLHHVITGRCRHEGPDVYSTIEAALVSAPSDYGPEAPAGLGWIANRACSPRPEDRYPDIPTLIEALEGWVQESFAESVLAAADEQMATAERVAQWSETHADGAAALAARTHLIKAQFGYERIWTSHQLPAARAGLSRAVEALVELELRALDPTSAQALVEVHPDPTERWLSMVDERVEAATLVLAEQRRLTQVGHRADLVDSRRSWLGLVAGFAVIVGGRWW